MATDDVMSNPQGRLYRKGEVPPETALRTKGPNQLCTSMDGGPEGLAGMAESATARGFQRSQAIGEDIYDTLRARAVLGYRCVASGPRLCPRLAWARNGGPGAKAEARVMTTLRV